MSRFAFVAAERANHAVAMPCRAVGASVSGSYARLRATPSVRTRAEAAAGLRGRIGRISAARRVRVRCRPQHDWLTIAARYDRPGGPTSRRSSGP